MEKINRFLIIFVVALFITITLGYASLSMSLSIHGASHIINPSWDIHWENIQITEGSVTAISAPTIDSNQTSVNYEVHFDTPGEFYEFTVDAKNAGTIDGMIDSIDSRLNGSPITILPNYLQYSIRYSDGVPISAKQALGAGTTETYKIRIEFKKDIQASDLPSTDQNLALSFTVTYVQKDSSAIAVARPISFAVDSWPTIIGAVRTGNTSVYHVGDTKEIDMGEYGTHTLRLVNMSTPDVCQTPGFSTSGCGFVVEFADTVASHEIKKDYSTVGGWAESEGRRFVNFEIFNALPSDLRAGIIDSYVVANTRYDESGSFSTDKLFLQSECEIYGSCRAIEQTSNRKLDFYEACGATLTGGSPCSVKDGGWSLRSVNQYDTNATNQYVWVYSDGSWGSSFTSVNGISPAFRIG